MEKVLIVVILLKTMEMMWMRWIVMLVEDVRVVSIIVEARACTLCVFVFVYLCICVFAEEKGVRDESVDC